MEGRTFVKEISIHIVLIEGAAYVTMQIRNPRHNTRVLAYQVNERWIGQAEQTKFEPAYHISNETVKI